MKVSILAGALALCFTASGANAAVVFNSNTPGIAFFTITTTGLYEVSAWGASGGNNGADGSLGGMGFGLSDIFQFNAGTQVFVSIGAAGMNSYSPQGGGGGGGAGTYVSAGSSLLLAAGGGGASYGIAGQDGQGPMQEDPGTAGDGGETSYSYGGSGGGGGSNGYSKGRDGVASYRSGGGIGGGYDQGGAGGQGSNGVPAGRGGDGIFAGGGGGGSAETGGTGGYGGGGGGYSGGAGYGLGGTSKNFFDDTFVTLATNRGNGVVTIASVTSAVPEPATLSLMLVGFGAVGCAIRQRRARFA